MKRQIKSFFGLDSGFGGIISSEVVSPLNYRSSGTPLGNSGWFFDSAGASGYDVFFNYGGLGDVVKAYEKCPPVYSIVNKQAYAYINGKTVTVDAKGKVFESAYTKKIKSLLAKPNALQNGKQFEAQAAVYIRLFGYAIILPIKPVGFGNEDAKALWLIPPYMCEFQYAKQTFYNLKQGFIASIKMTYGNEVSYINPDDVIILRDVTPGFDTLFLPNSPIKSIQQNISNLIGNYNSKGMLINYRGALGILSQEKDPLSNVPMDADTKKELQADFMQYGLRSGQWKFIISNTALKWQQMGIPYRDLMLTEWGEDDTMAICDALNYPYKLLANTAGNSMAGTEAEAYKKMLYQDFVIPFAEMIYEQLTSAFNADKNGCSIAKDYSHITVIQEDKINAGRARMYLNQGLLIEWENNLITANQWLAMNQLDPIPDGDKYYDDWIREGKIFGKSKLPIEPQNSNNGN